MRTLIAALAASLILGCSLGSAGFSDWENFGGAISVAKTTTATAAVTTGLQFGINAGETWEFEFRLITACSGAGGIKYQIAVPAGATVAAQVIGSGGGSTSIASARITASSTLTTIIFNNVAAQVWAMIFGTVTAASTPGLVTAGYASVTNGQTSTIAVGSNVRATKL